MSVFKFKQFQVKQKDAEAKIGTDGVLLGAWTPLGLHPKRILDIGAGTGLIALMLAQRTENTSITAIEIDQKAFKECLFNFEQSKWIERLEIKHISLNELKTHQKFDLIASNPPFYTDTYYAKNSARNNARNTSSLSFEDLIKKSNQLLNPNGIFSVIIPFKEDATFIQLAKAQDLYPFKITHVKGNPHTDFKRSLIAFKKTEEPLFINELIIEIERHQYTEAYKCLTKDFYLKM